MLYANTFTKIYHGLTLCAEEDAFTQSLNT
jgi:hypothetical protein